MKKTYRHLYEEVNFLPAWVREKRAGRVVHWRMGVMTLLLLVVMWWGHGLLRAERDVVAKQYEGVAAFVHAYHYGWREIEHYGVVRERLMAANRQYLRRHLPVSVSELIATLAMLSPERVTLDEMELVLQDRDVIARGKKASRFVFSFRGMTREPLALDAFLNGMHSHAFFRSVRLEYLRDVSDEGERLYAFAVNCEVPLERPFVKDYVALKGGE